MNMIWVWRLLFIYILFSLCTSLIYADTNQSVNKTAINNNSPVIFSFSNAIESYDNMIEKNLTPAWYTDKNISVEERYNRMSRDLSDADVHFSDDGQPIICLYCIPIPIS